MEMYSCTPTEKSPFFRLFCFRSVLTERFMFRTSSCAKGAQSDHCPTMRDDLISFPPSHRAYRADVHTPSASGPFPALTESFLALAARELPPPPASFRSACRGSLPFRFPTHWIEILRQGIRNKPGLLQHLHIPCRLLPARIETVRSTALLRLKRCTHIRQTRSNGV